MIELDDIRRYLYKALSSYTSRSEYEDGLQEGLIRAWKDIEAGNDDFLHVAHRARRWAINFILDSDSGRRKATGAPSRTMEGRKDSHGEATREKIRQFITHYRELHGEEPTQKQVAEGIGYTPQTVGHHMRNMREGRGTNHAIYNEFYGEKRVDYNAYRTSSYNIDSIPEDQSKVFARHAISFEDQSVAEMDFYNTLAKVDPIHQQVLFWYYVEGYNYQEVAHLGGATATRASNIGQRRVQAAHKAVLAALYPDKHPEVCTKGHVRTLENTLINVQKTTGRADKTCLDCNSGRGRNTTKQTKGRAVATHCKNNHEIRGLRKGSGKRYCKVCNSLNNNPGRTIEDISPESTIWNWDEGARNELS